MKTFYSLLVAAAMVLGATSCQQDAIEEVATNEPVSFTATLNSTRTELGEGNKVMWNADDKITIYTQENTAGVVFDGDATEAAATATFTTTSEFVASQTGYLAVYPELKYDLSTWPATGTVPAATYADGVYSVPVNIGIEQDAVANGWDEKYNYMVAYSQNNQLAFQAATALIKFTYTGYDGMSLDFYAEGANLAGEATLNYNTADGSISYTTTGTSTNITLFNLVQGETYYIPIYPGKVDYFHLRGMGITGNYETFYSYEGEFEFKAGKIYTVKAKEQEQGTPSPYTLMDPNGLIYVPMSIDETTGYHYAKNVAWGENIFFYAWDMNVGETMISASKTLVAGEWQATQNPATAGFTMPEGDLFDVYLSGDLTMMCVVPAGAEIPAMPDPQYHIYVYNSSNWSPLNLYVWDAGGPINGAWPGTALTSTKWIGEGEYFVYDIPTEYNGQTINFIINNGSAQTADLSTVVEGDVYYYTNGTVVEDPEYPVIPEAKKLYLVPNANWKIDNARFAAYFYGSGEKWVGMTDEDGDGIYECELPEGYPNVIFCRMNPGTTDNNWDNKWNQTADLTVPTDGTNCYTVPEGSWDNGEGTWSTK